ncbi:MAG: TonB-dependent siderophore receptor [Sphingobium sp.]|uniref:TonB-dependent siderophore receptor n=1 Tax=Sphingobium sp. TaxID=1912891 RepID=UPI001A2EE9EE|nr:TonB-dependent siderophore receptor [Sphingobium sp.]MBJ7443684.1 TonB-dependent siderophore receptor [Sphingobium sp.]
MRPSSTFRLAMIASTAAIALPTSAIAQAPAAETSDIVVTGLKRQYFGDTPVKEIPQAVQFLEGKLLNDLNITRLDTALELASGISKQNNFGGLWDSFAIRGFAGDENFPSGFLVNGFNGGRGYGGPRDASNVERIEVLKGPNSALFGRGEPGGTVNIVSKKPTFKEGGSFSVAGGKWDTYRVEGDYNLPITDTVAIRLTGAVENAESFRDTVETRKYVLNPSFLAKLSDKTIFTYELEYVNQEVPFDRGVVAIPTVAAAGTTYTLGAIPNTRFLSNPNDGPIAIEVLGHQAQLQHDLSDDWVVMLGAGYKDTTFEGFSSDPELALGRQLIDNDGRTLSRQRRYRDYSTKHMVFRGEISGKLETGSIVHNIRVGADWDKFEIETFQNRYRPTAVDQSYSIDIFNPNYTIAVPTADKYAVIQNSTEVQKAWGVYAQDQIEITEQFKVRFGGRYDHFNQDIVNRINNSNPNTTYSKFSPMAGLVFEPTKSLSFYASYGKGFRPNSGVDAANNPFAPEISKSYEVGAKFVTPDGRITSTLSLYKMKKSNVLTADLLTGLSVAVGEAKSQGVEFDVNAKLPAGFELFMTYAYTDAGWADTYPTAGVLKNDPLINIPKHQGNILLFKNFAIGDHEAMLGAGVNHVGKRLGQTAANFYLPSYTIAKLLASVTINDQFKLSANVDNLFDKKYYASSYAALWVQPGTPRSFTVRGTFNF